MYNYTVCFYILKIYLKKLIFLFQINFFWFFKIILMCWYQKWFLKNKKYIILIYFLIKNTLKSNHNHTSKQKAAQTRSDLKIKFYNKVSTCT
jgi:hypothetical protein